MSIAPYYFCLCTNQKETLAFNPFKLTKSFNRGQRFGGAFIPGEFLGLF